MVTRFRGAFCRMQRMTDGCFSGAQYCFPSGRVAIVMSIAQLARGGIPSMKTAGLLIRTLIAAGAVRADFSYVSARKGGQGPMAMGPQTTKQYFKGQKMKTEAGDLSTIVDFDGKTITIIYNSQKTYTVTPVAEIAKTVRAPGARA